MKKNVQWMITIVGILSLPFLIVELYVSFSFDDGDNGDDETNSIIKSVPVVISTVSVFQDSTPVSEVRTASKKVVFYYSLCRQDGSGSVVHDMLFAHAYTYHINENQSSNIYAEYGGCCDYDISPFNSLNETRKLLFDLRWDTILKIDCPPSLSSQNHPDNVFDNFIDMRFDPDIHRKHDVLTFTKAWRNYFIHQITAATGNATGGCGTTGNQLHMYNNFDTAPYDTLAPYDNNGNTNNNNEIVHDDVPMQYSIAVHIRRGDVNPCDYEDRYLPNSYYLYLIQQYISALLSSSSSDASQPPSMTISRENIVVTIYSESISYEPLDIFQQLNYTVSVDDKLCTVWLALSTAHVAILSKSSFSYVPAILNPHRVVYAPFWHQPMDHWDVAADTLLSQSMVEITKFRTKCVW